MDILLPKAELAAASKAEGTILTWIWKRCRSFLAQIFMVILVGIFMRFYVDGREFLLSHHLSLTQADGSIIPKLVLLPVQSDITTLISILASSARAAATLWVAGIDLRCIFLFMRTGGITFEGLKSMFGGSLPGRHQFRDKRNYIILAIFHLAIFSSTYISSVLTGSVTWKSASQYWPGQPVPGIPLGQAGDHIYSTADPRLMDADIEYTTAIYSIFYGSALTRDSSSMHRLAPDSIIALPNGSRFDQITIPFFAVDRFEWIKNPNASLSSSQLAAAAVTNGTGPRVMNLLKWGLIPDGNWGPSNVVFPAPLTISESRILVMWTGPASPSGCPLYSSLNMALPSDVQPYVAPLDNLPSCFIFANVTYRAGAARCRRCQILGPAVIQDIGNVKDLQLVEDSVTSAALAIAPYVSTALVQTTYAMPVPPAFQTLQEQSIEILSRSYQVAWNGLTSLYGIAAFEDSEVSIAVDASVASVLMWRVALWGIFHAILLSFGFLFRHIHVRGSHPWIEDPAVAALLVDPTSITGDIEKWAGEDTPHIAGKLKLYEHDGKKTYIFLEDTDGEEDNEPDSTPDPEGDPEKRK